MRRSPVNDGALDELILAGRRLAAIKSFRVATGASLLAARDAINERTRALRAAGHVPRSYRMPLPFVDRAKIVLVIGILSVALCALLALCIITCCAVVQANSNHHPIR
jgi:hypothetical protein